MNEKPASWNNISTNKVPNTWNTDNMVLSPQIWTRQSELPGIWNEDRQLPGNWNNCSSASPEMWNISGILSDEWGRGGNFPEYWGNSEQACLLPQNRGAVNAANVADAALNAAGIFAGAAKKFGNAAKNAAGNAAAYARSNDAREKLDSAKNKAQSLAGGAGAAFSSLKGKTASFVNDRKAALSDPEQIDENAAELNENFTSENTILADDYNAENEINEPVPVEETAFEDHIQPQPEQTYEPAQNESYDNTPLADTPVPDTAQPANSPVRPPHTPQSARTSVQPANTVPSVSTPDPYNSVPQYSSPGYIIQKQSSSPILIAVIIILVLIVGILGGMFFMMSRDKNNDNVSQNSSVSVAKDDNTELGSGNVNEGSTNENDSEKSTESPVQNKLSVNIPCGKSDVNINYANIINNMDFPIPNKGFILDLNNDGVNEMIIPDINDMSYIMYYYDGNSSRSCNFGNFMALDNFVIYQVDGEENKKYIYYRDNYSYKSLQGYYSLTSADELNIFIDYPENNGKYSADWTIDFNKNENYAKGNESVETFYAQPSECHDKLLSAFKNYGFKIAENSKYTEIEGLYCDELIKKLSGKTDNDNIPVAYKGLDFIDNAPDDMEFYENAKTGYVATESTGLNLRQKPSVDSEKIVEMPKNSEIKILGASQKWYYVSYFSGGVGAFAKNFYGYASKEYISSKPVSSDPYSDIKQEILHSVDNEDYRGKNSHIENAPSDMVFYSTGNRSSLNISNPIVYEGPGTNYSQIPTYQDRFDIVGENSSWYYIQWYEGAGRFAHPCYGYLNKNSININNSDVINETEVYECNKYGRINTHGGHLPSITIDYIIGKSDKMIILRDSLGNGWHIQAVRSCNSMNITWYEIYDADDGDYYGWIDGSFIDFD